MTSTKIARLVALAALAATTVVATACGHEARGAAPAEVTAVPVRVASVSTAGADTIAAGGTLGAKDEIPLAFKIGGVVSSVSVDEGARVRAGQPLAALDLREIDAAVSKATVGAE